MATKKAPARKRPTKRARKGHPKRVRLSKLPPSGKLIAAPESWERASPEHFRRLRVKYHASIELAARIVGVTFSTYWRWENGKQNAVGYKYAMALMSFRRYAKAHPQEAAGKKVFRLNAL